MKKKYVAPLLEAFMFNTTNVLMNSGNFEVTDLSTDETDVLSQWEQI